MEHWIHTQLGNLVEVKSGIGFPKELQGKAKGTYPVYKVGDISKAFLMNNAFVDKAENYVSNEEVKILKGSIFREGSTVFAKIGEAVKLNRRGYISQPGLADNNVMAVIPLDNSLDRFIYFFLNTVDLSEAARSTTVPSIRKGDIENLIIPLPPLAEQHYLADKLDSLLARIQTLSDQLAAVPALLKQFRQSVLADAVSGKLINIKSLTYQNLNQCAKIHNGARKPISLKERNKIQGNIPYYGATGVVDYVNGYTHKGRFLLVGEDGANLLSKAKDLAYIVEGEIWVNNHAHVLKEYENYSLDFIKIVINSLNLSNWVTGTAQPKLTKKALESLPIPKFTFAEQTEIVRRVEALFALADQIEQQSRAAAKRVALLTQSVLAKAFRGELSAQWRCEHPDLISGDNSAAALLARIQAEREATGKKSRRA